MNAWNGVCVLSRLGSDLGVTFFLSSNEHTQLASHPAHQIYPEHDPVAADVAQLQPGRFRYEPFAYTNAQLGIAGVIGAG